MAKTQQEYEKMAQTLTYPTQAFIGGKFVNAKSGKTSETVNPATGKVFASFSSCDENDVDEAVKIARKVFDSGVWSKMHPTERKKILLKYADILESKLEELAVLETLDSGKPIGEVMSTDIPEAVHAIRWHAEFTDKRYGQVSPSGDGAVGLVTKEAVGVVACIMPWNFPIMTTTWKLAPALAEGNSVILKPATQTSLTTLRLAELAAEAGIPEGVLQVLPGSGSIIGKALGLHMGVNAISFTGSTEVGSQLLEYSAKSNLKKISLELGGKSPFVLCDDIKDLNKAVNAALAASFWNTGQNCTANTRIFVPNSRKDEFVELMLKGLEKDWHIGDPMNPANNMGPMISESHFKNVMHYVEKGISEGCKVATGGHALNIGSGIYVAPTLFVDPKMDSEIITHEIFGPVSCIIGVNSNEEAIKLANDTNYGLQATLFTDNLQNAHIYARQLKAGTVSVNKYCEGDITTPFGGLKMSGFGGQDNAEAAHEQYSELKTIFINLE